MAAESAIVMRDGPAGVRAGLRDGPDVWEVVAVHRSFDNITTRTAAWLDQPVVAIEAALRHYESHRHEIDVWINSNEEAAAKAISVSVDARRMIASSAEGLTGDERAFFDSDALEKSVQDFLKGDLGSGNAADRIWNRACSPVFTPRLPGDQALRDAISFDGEISSGGLDFAIDEAGYEEARVAAEGLRTLGAPDLAAVLDEARALVARVVNGAGAIDIVDLTDAEEADLAALAVRYNALTEGPEGTLFERFTRSLAANPATFEPA
ncbi:MAG TPA: hypothetical protein VH063_05505 [Gaiellaceae bacterium]|jgi:hypothetical protein|nr:hypothetical protein [Gaiellaceae bacterium]